MYLQCYWLRPCFYLCICPYAQLPKLHHEHTSSGQIRTYHRTLYQGMMEQRVSCVCGAELPCKLITAEHIKADCQ